MPIIKHISVHSTPLSNIEYILNGDKNDEMKFATGLNCTDNPQSAYDEFRRTFEYYAKERFFKSDLNSQEMKNDENGRSKEKVRIHHYVQSFDPKENVTPDEAHKIGIEWAKKTFGENTQIIISTHLDKGHIHNHFAVCPYSLDGKRWIDNLKTLKLARKISDEIALQHGLHIIENPKHKNTMKYIEWLTKQNGTSWKNQLAGEIDKLILTDDVQSISDLASKLKEQGYVIRSGKYLSIKAPKQKYAIRSYRLGDGYSVEDLQYRILNKEQEISLSAIQKLSGIQKEYAICMRQMQITVFTKKSTKTTYADLRQSADLLNYLSNNSITSFDELENRLNASAEDYQNSVLKKKQLSSQIERVEKIVADARIYLDLADKDFLTADEKEAYKQVSYIEKMSIGNHNDLEQRKHNVDFLKSELAELEIKVEQQKENRDYLLQLYRTYKRDMQNDYFDEIKQQAEADLQEQQAVQEQQENNQDYKER